MTVKAQGQITLSCVVDVQATYRYYLLQSSTLTKPAKPITFPPSSIWDDMEPTYTDGSTNSLYFVDCTVFCDETFSYSEVSLSSSYEAAKTAYNKAVNAQNSANQVQNDLVNNYYNKTKIEAMFELNNDSIVSRVSESIQIGARNLIRNSANLLFSGYYFTGPFKASYDGVDKITVSCGASASSDANGNVLFRTTAAISDDGAGNIKII